MLLAGASIFVRTIGLKLPYLQPKSSIKHWYSFIKSDSSDLIIFHYSGRKITYLVLLLTIIITLSSAI